MTSRPTRLLSEGEFVVLMALMGSAVALATDIMLPALGEIGRDLAVARVNDTQLVISSLFLGYAIGQLFVGPLSDSVGRKPAIATCYALFMVGCLLSLFATSYGAMIAGRVLQGLGAAGPRIISIAIARDLYVGRPMARILSLVMSVFILVPIIAPALGQGIMMVGSWRSTFGFMLAISAFTLAWYLLRQPETLAEENRRAFSFGVVWAGTREALSHRTTLGYTLAAGFIFGAFVAYLSTARQVFQDLYHSGPLFALWFGLAAVFIGIASLVNARLVLRFGMRLLARRALLGITLLSAVYLIAVVSFDGRPPFWSFMAWLGASFFFIGLLFSNFNALAMEPLGHMAGLGAALVGAISTLVSLPLGWAIGAAFDDSVLPLVGGFAALGGVSMLVSAWAERSP